MKKLLFSSFTALMMLFSMFGHVRAQGTSETAKPSIALLSLAMDELTDNAEISKYVPITVSIMEGSSEYDYETADVYYTINGGDIEPTKENFTADGPVKKITVDGGMNQGGIEVNVNGTEITVKAKAYITVAGEDAEVVTDVKTVSLKLKHLDAPQFEQASGSTIKMGNAVKLTGIPEDAHVFYSTTDVLPAMLNYGQVAGIEPYDENGGIVITENVTIKAIAWAEDDDLVFVASDMVTASYTVQKPQVTVALSATAWSEGEDAPKVSVTPEEGIEIGALADGKVAVKVDLFKMDAYPEETAVQYITATGETALETEKLTKGVWFLSYTLVKKEEDKEVVFDGAEIKVAEDDMSLTVGGAENSLVLSVQFKPAKWEIGSEAPLMVMAGITNDDNLSFGTDDDNSEIVVLITFTKDSEIKKYLLTQSFGEIDPEELGLTEGTWEVTYKAGKATSTIENFTELERTVEMATTTTTSIEIVAATVLELTFDPAHNAEVKSGDTITITANVDDVNIYFCTYASKDAAEKDDTLNIVRNGIRYGEFDEDDDEVGKPIVTSTKPVVKAGVNVGDEWQFFYAVYDIESTEPEITLYFVDETFGKNFPMELNIECEENPAYERADFHVYYTTDGSEPSEEAYKAQGAAGGPVKMTGYYQDKDGAWIYPTITLSAYATVKAVATVKVGTDKTIATSMITKEFNAENFQVLAKNPAFSESAQEVAKGTKVKINVEKPEGLTSDQMFIVNYTLDGSDPLEERLLNDMSGDMQDVIKSYDYENEEEITIDSNTTIKAIAYVIWYGGGMMKYEDEYGYGSDIVEHTYLIAKDIAMPVITPNGGEVKKGDTIRLSAAEGARIYYSINADTVTPNSTLYVAANGIVIDKDTTTVRAIAVKKTEGQSDSVSNIATATFTVKKDTVAAPKFSVAAGSVEKGTKVRITCDTAGADIYYTVNGGNPTVASTKYEDEISIDSNMTIKAVAIKAGLVNSAIVTAAYTLKGDEPEKDTVAAPTFNHRDGDKVKVGDSVVISCVTEGAEIFYALDTASTFVKYESAIKVTKAVAVKAYAKKGEAISDTVKVALVIDNTANEGKELAGVSVYPNPSDGRFSVSVPVNAVVEVFAANGRMIKRVNVSAGENAMQLDNAGVYFIRVRANGQETVKKVVVR
ncbi:MAG: chitobiase/beta-hexosaminidase C-terminal domain-containing protein [Bacteroides sp.]|nr:chitobiase/beta-hexosaminidase C-terminal domain-containing protein [Ruminococcus flavefaciens]MCM1555284.1 chitobiase/beta-hexosaminidase C-terminal domain-containing protein [Bacteroides sp.]